MQVVTSGWHLPLVLPVVPALGTAHRAEALADAAKDASHLADARKGRVDAVLVESATGAGNFGSAHRLTPEEALTAGEKWVGPEYREMGGSGTGVFRNAEGTTQFRIDEGSITGAHGDVGPHVHYEVLDPSRRGKDAIISNNHVPLE